MKALRFLDRSNYYWRAILGKDLSWSVIVVYMLIGNPRRISY